ncbi:MAG: amidohydrolase family protein [Planctomycetaceae bacterium]
MSQKPLVIDAHQHFWELGRFDTAWLHAPDKTKICRNFLPPDLKPHLDAVGVDKTVFVQTQHNVEENRWALAFAEEHDWIAGVVGWVDLASPDCEQQLEEFISQERFVGIRHITQDEPDDNFIIRPDVLNGLAVLQKHNVPFDLLFYVKHLHHAAPLGRQFPDLPMVIDHISKPEIKLGNIDNWAPHLRAAAECPNIYCKLSGMITEADWEDWTAADLQPYIDIALEAFGPNRLMYGSDWPVCELAGSYEQVFRALEECLGSLSETERERIFGGTAIEFYDLNVS